MTDRARVPFALVGVVLLVGALVYAATAVHGPTTTDRTAALAVDRAETTARPTVRQATRRATLAAIRAPVIERANTTAGRALDPDQPFRDALRLRIYRGVTDALAEADTRVGRARVETRLPAVTDLRTGIERVELRSVRNDTALQVRIRGLSHTVFRDGRRLRETNGSITVTVGVPAIAVHERVDRYERRLNTGPTAGPGLGRRLTGRLVPIAAARGLAQYGGLAIDNVLANRHVELATNGARLAIQRQTFGRADPAGRAAFGRAMARVGLTDTLTASVADQSFVYGVLTGARQRANDRATLAPATRQTTTVGVNRTAAAAAADVTASRLARLLRVTHRVPIVRTATSRVIARDPEPPAEPPGPDWARLTTRRTTERTVVQSERLSTDRIAASRRRVVVTHVRRIRWANGTRTRTTTARWQTTHRVRLSLADQYQPAVPGPTRPTRTPLTERSAREQARERLPVTGAAADRLAVHAVETGDRTDRATVTADVSRKTRLAALRAVFALRDRLRNVSVTLTGREAASGADVSTRLAVKLRDRRARLVDAPDRYANATERAVVAVRAAYVDRVIARLDDRPTVGDRLRARLAEAGVRVRAASRAAERATRPEPQSFGRGPLGTVSLVPDADPAYLTVTPVDPALVESRERPVTPLAARNVNVFSLPFGDAASDVIGDLASDDRRVSLQTAARTARVARQTLTRARAANRSAPKLATRFDRLRTRLNASLDPVERTAVRTLARGTRLDDRAATALVEQARYPTHGATALAVTNGSYAARLAAAAARRLELAEPSEDRLAVRLAADTREAATAVGVPRALVNETLSARRVAVRSGLTEYAATTARETAVRSHQRLARRTKRSLPPLAGLPIAPVPGYWYATVNVWTVSVRGTYPEFAVAVRPEETDATTARYVRTAEQVAFDADGDGTVERVGRNRPVSFETRAVAFAVVPPGKRGVGDITRDEQSVGWPAGNTSDNSFADSPNGQHMLYDTVAADTPAAVRAAYGERLKEVLADRDPAAVADEAGVDSTVVESFADGQTGHGTLTDAAAVLGVTEDIDPSAVEGELRDQLMLGMSSAILDVDTIAAEIETDLTGQELQQALEGRTRISLDELAKVHALIRSRQP